MKQKEAVMEAIEKEAWTYYHYEQGGIRITHNHFGNDHGPAHMHVEAQGLKTRIGPNGKPLPNNPPLSP